MSTSTRAEATLRQMLPAEAVFDVHVRHVTDGRATVEMHLPGDDAGRPSSLGWLGTLADVATGRAIMSRTPPDVYCQTVSLRLDLGDHPPLLGSAVTAVGEVASLADAFALCRVAIHDEGGQIVAAGTARFALTQLAGADVAVAAPPAGPTGSTVDLDRLLRMQAVPSPPGQAAYDALPWTDLANQHGVVHGGVHASLADVVLSQAVASVSGGRATLLDVSLTYHRPAPIDGTRLRIEGTVDRLGRRVAVASGAISTEKGTLLTSVYGTFAVARA